jgi:L-alanine-DL-glutamate epimerase-like enolase superfamily enzyme
MSSASRIVGVRAKVLRAPISDGIAMSFAPLRHRTMVLVEIETADSRVGYGESWVNYPTWAPTERLATLGEGVFPLILGKDAADVEHLQHELKTILTPLGRQWGAPGPVMQAISAVDIALWDLRGRATSTAISGLLNTRVRDRVAAYASSLGPGGVSDLARHCRDDGYKAVKVKVGFGKETDEANLAAARDALGKSVTIYADANQAWSLSEALAMAPMLEEYGVAWIEEPLAGNHLEDLEELHRVTGQLIATGENLYGLDAFRPYVESPAIAVLQPDVAKTGGITEVWAICNKAESCGKTVIPHLYGGALAYAATLQLAACARSVSAIEYDVRANPLRDPLLINPPRPLNGTVAIPDNPGLGLDLNLDAVAAYGDQTTLAISQTESDT